MIQITLTQTHAIACDRCGKAGPQADTLDEAHKRASAKHGTKSWWWKVGEMQHSLTLCAACAASTPSKPPAVAETEAG
jgi:hypothetical protein